MGMVYFKSNDGTLVTMDGEDSIEVSKSNVVASSSVISTKNSSDDVIEGNLVLNVQGRVTYSKTPSQTGNPTPEEWVDLIESTISARTRFTVYSVKYQGGKPLLKDYPNMVIADYGYTVSKFEDTIIARITFQEVFVSGAATETTLAPKKSSTAKESYPSTTTGGKGVSTEDTEERNSLYRGFFGGSLFGE